MIPLHSEKVRIDVAAIFECHFSITNCSIETDSVRREQCANLAEPISMNVEKLKILCCIRKQY